MTENQDFARLAALRDFFWAPNGAALRQAYADLAATAALTSAVSMPGQADEESTDWQAVEFAFNRFFVGPQAVIAPPFASIYLDPEPQLMGRTTLQVRDLYRLLNLQPAGAGVIPDDHISFELDLYRQLLMAAVLRPAMS